MGHENQDERLIRQYLLGQLQEDEREQIEEKMMTDTEFFNQVLLAEDDLVEQFVNEELSRRDRRRFKELFLSTPAGRRQVAFNQALSKYVAHVNSKKQNGFMDRLQYWAGALSPALNTIVAVSIILIVAVTVWFLILRRDPVAEGRTALVSLYSKRRPTQARLDGFQHAPFVALMGDDKDLPDRAQRDRAGLLVQNAANQRPGDADAIHLLGQYYLSIGDYDEAINQLRRARDLTPDDSKILNDLGSALYEKARRSGDNSANSLALDESIRSLNRAIELSPKLAEAYFNRALCSELLLQWQNAEADWQTYLSLDSTSPWSTDAREGLQRVQEQQKKVSWNDERLLQDFIGAGASKDKGAGWRALSISIGTRSSAIVERLIAESLSEGTGGDRPHAALLKWAGQLAIEEGGDFSIADLAQRYSNGPPSDVTEIQSVRKRFTESVGLFQQGRLREAADAFEDSALQFERVGDTPHAWHARYLEAHCHLRLPNLEAAAGLFDAVRSASQANRYRWLESRADDGLAELCFTRSEYSRAMQFARMALDLARSLSNATCVGRSCAQLSGIYLQLGDYDQAGEFAWEGLQAVNKQPIDPLQASLPYDAAADVYTASRLYGLAVDFEIESLRRADLGGNPISISFSHANVGRLYSGQGDDARGLEQLKLASDTAASIPESDSGDLRAFVSLCVGDIERKEGELDKALSNYEDALKSYSQSSRHNEAFLARMGKLLCHIKRGDLDDAKSEMVSIRDLIERFAAEIVEEKNRTLFTEKLAEFHDAVIGFCYSPLNDSSLAYEYAEMFRARSLYDLATGSPEATSNPGGLNIKTRSAPLRPDQITSAIPQGAQLVQYAVLDERSLVWVVSRSGIQTREIPVSRKELTDRIDKFVSLCRRPEGVDVTADATALYEILIQPIAQFLDAGKQLCIVPDNVLSRLPFVALKSPVTHRYLIEDFVISGAPSSSLFIRCTELAKTKRSLAVEKVVSVGDPAFNQETHNLSRLPDAAHCASAVADLYPFRTLLIGPQATKPAVLEAMNQANVINLATHYLIDPRSPMLSRLLLSSDGSASDGGDLRGYDLYGLRLPQTKLVVLAGCQTLGDQVLNFEGAVGAARAFISAGVPIVVASYWPVDSKATSDLLVEFHKRRTSGSTSSARALRDAQLAMITRGAYGQAPFYWAGFSLIGAYADF